MVSVVTVVEVAVTVVRVVVVDNEVVVFVLVGALFLLLPYLLQLLLFSVVIGKCKPFGGQYRRPRGGGGRGASGNAS